MLIVPLLICLCIIGYSRPDELVRVEGVGDVFIPRKDGSGKGCFDIAVFEDVSVGRGNHKSVHLLFVDFIDTAVGLFHFLGGGISS